MDRAGLKAKAKKSIEGKVFTLFALFLLMSIAVAILTTITFGLGSIFLAGGVMMSTAFIFLGVVNSNRRPDIKDLMYGFKEKTYLSGLIGYLRYSIFTALWSLLFVIPGIVKGISYSMMFYIMVDHPTMDAGEAQKKSMAMTMGHKGELFVLYLSFIPWYLLTILTLGLASIYVAPYMNSTFALYYEGLKNKSPEKQE